jgi:hypothetical protein
VDVAGTLLGVALEVMRDNDFERPTPRYGIRTARLLKRDQRARVWRGQWAQSLWLKCATGKDLFPRD